MSESKGEKSFCEKYFEKFDFIKSQTIAELLDNGFDSFHSLLALDLGLDLDKLTAISLGQRSLLRKTLLPLKQNSENSFCSTIDKSFNDLVVNEKSFSLKCEVEGEEERGERERPTPVRIVEIDVDAQSSDHVMEQMEEAIDETDQIHHATLQLSAKQREESVIKPVKQEMADSPDKKLLNKLLAQNSDKIEFKEIQENNKEFKQKFRQIFFDNFCTKFVFCEICRKILTKNKYFLRKHLENNCGIKGRKLCATQMRKKCFIGVKKLVLDFDQKRNEYTFEGIVVNNYETIVGQKGVKDKSFGHFSEFCSQHLRLSADNNADSHVRQHNTEETFTCDACLYTCDTRQVLDSHMRAVHVDGNESIVEYSCQAFGCSFCSVWKLKVKKHMLNVHNEEFVNELKENDIKDKVKHKIQKLIFS